MPPADAGLVFAVFCLVGAAAMAVLYRWLRWRIVLTVRRQQGSGQPIFYKQPGSLFFIRCATSRFCSWGSRRWECWRGWSPELMLPAEHVAGAAGNELLQLGRDHLPM
jgi:hypothetical protein